MRKGQLEMFVEDVNRIHFGMTNSHGAEIATMKLMSGGGALLLFTIGN